MISRCEFLPYWYICMKCEAFFVVSPRAQSAAVNPNLYLVCRRVNEERRGKSERPQPLQLNKLNQWSCHNIKHTMMKWNTPNAGMKSEKCLSCPQWHSIKVCEMLSFFHTRPAWLLLSSYLLPHGGATPAVDPAKPERTDPASGRKRKMGLKTSCAVVNETSPIIQFRLRNGYETR